MDVKIFHWDRDLFENWVREIETIAFAKSVGDGGDGAAMGGEGGGNGEWKGYMYIYIWM